MAWCKWNNISEGRASCIFSLVHYRETSVHFCNTKRFYIPEDKFFTLVYTRRPNFYNKPDESQN